MKIFDCSNMAPLNRTHFTGPATNDVMRYLREYAPTYGHEFVGMDSAEVIITNDIFTEEALRSGKKLVKRMDGVFAMTESVHRNHPLNLAAKQADVVIFISRFSQEHYHHLYDIAEEGLKSEHVVTHWVDPAIFKNGHVDKPDEFTFCASASSWAREEKRLNSILDFAKNNSKFRFVLIGYMPNVDIPSNVTSLGYLEPLEMARAMNLCHAFLNLSYRDAATKTIPQAISCGLPCLYADSGGVREMVGPYGQGIVDNYDHLMGDFCVRSSIPPLRNENIEYSLNKFMSKYSYYKELLDRFSTKHMFDRFLSGYFRAMEES